MATKKDYESNKPYMDLPDYKGPFIPGLRYQDFSKDRLAYFYNQAGRMFLTIDAAWERYITEKFGWEEALAGHVDIWQNRMSYPEHKLMFDMLGIWGENDLNAVMKHNQFDIGWTYPLFEFDCQMPDEEHGIVTCYTCTAVTYWERKGQPERLHDICYVQEPKCFDNYAANVNPQITVRPTKRPPKKDKNDPSEPVCIWEYTYVRNARKEWPKSDWLERWKDWKDEDIE